MIVSEIFSSIQGEGLWIGRRQVFLRLAGCDLRCQWCDTPDSLVADSRALAQVETIPSRGAFCEVDSRMSPAQAASHVRQLAVASPHHSLSLTGGEPLLQARELAEMCRLLEDLSIGVFLETGGHRPSELAILQPWLDFVSFDLKLPSSTEERSLWHEHAAFLEQLGDLAGCAKVVLTAATTSEDMLRACQLLQIGDWELVIQAAQGQQGELDLAGWYERAAEELGPGRVRIMGQMHKQMGLL